MAAQIAAVSYCQSEIVDWPAMIVYKWCHYGTKIRNDCTRKGQSGVKVVWAEGNISFKYVYALILVNLLKLTNFFTQIAV